MVEAKCGLRESRLAIEKQIERNDYSKESGESIGVVRRIQAHRGGLVSEDGLLDGRRL